MCRELSRRIYEQLHVETLLELYAAAQLGRLEQIPGLGRKRIHAVKECLSQRVGKSDKKLTVTYPETDRSIPVGELLAIDAEYRRRVDAGTLTKSLRRNSIPENSCGCRFCTPSGMGDTIPRCF